jgi:hypothetical protein
MHCVRLVASPQSPAPALAVQVVKAPTEKSSSSGRSLESHYGRKSLTDSTRGVSLHLSARLSAEPDALLRLPRARSSARTCSEDLSCKSEEHRGRCRSLAGIDISRGQLLGCQPSYHAGRLRARVDSGAAYSAGTDRCRVHHGVRRSSFIRHLGAIWSRKYFLHF